MLQTNDLLKTTKPEGTSYSQRKVRELIQHNLIQLCHTQPSITYICKKIGINRQQFAKYLDGRSVPSIENIIRISKYFGISIDEFVSDPQIYSKVNEAVNSNLQLPVFAQRAADLIDHTIQTSCTLRFPKDGYYLSYNNSFRPIDSYKERIFVALIKLKSIENTVYYERRQYNNNKEGVGIVPNIFRGIGYVILEGLQITYVDTYDIDAFSSISLKQTSLGAPDFIGIQLVRAFTHTHEAAASRVFWKFQGEKPDVRSLIKKCGMFKPNDNSLNPKWIEWLKQGYDQECHVIRGLE